jgi:hypothetical protein
VGYGLVSPVDEMLDQFKVIEDVCFAEPNIMSAFLQIALFAPFLQHELGYPKRFAEFTASNKGGLNLCGHWFILHRVRGANALVTHSKSQGSKTLACDCPNRW